MQALLLIAHGSRLDASNNEVRALVENLKPKLETKFNFIQAAFLELSAPSISEAIDNLVSSGVSKITVLPYFLNQGRHVSEDVPHELIVKEAQYPDLIITTLPYFGRSNEIIDLLEKQINESSHN